MEIVPIKSQMDYRRVLKEIEGLMGAERETPEGGVWTCSLRSWRLGSASVFQSITETIENHMERNGLERSDLRPARANRGFEAASAEDLDELYN